MDTILSLKIYNGEGVIDTLFPNADNPIEIGAFRYDAKRMGGAPTISASVNYPSCLDEEWTDNVYALFNGEKYFLKQTPTSSYDNTSTMYKHDLVLVSERVILDDVYFFDTVVGDPQGSDKPVSNSTKVVFFGNVREFADRLNASLEYSGIDYRVEVDQEVGSEEKLMSFEDQFLSNVLQEIYNTYEVPYYFDGKTIRIGYSKAGVVAPEFSYGVDNALLSITKNNANYKIVNRATATGSSDNIPFYYPNNSPKGDIEALVSREGAGVVIKDYEKYANEVGLDEAIRYSAVPQVTITKVLDKNGNNYFTGGTQYRECGWMGFNDEFTIYINADKEANIALDIVSVSQFGKRESDGRLTEALYSVVTKVFVDGKQIGDGGDVIEMKVKAGETIVKAYMNYRFDHTQSSYTFIGNSGISYSVETLDTYAWYLGDKKIEPEKLGIKVGDVSVFREGDTITQKLVRYVKTSDRLLPSVYRDSFGSERFYNAINGLYPFEPEEGYELKSNEYILNGFVHNDNYKNAAGEYIKFNNPFVEGHPKEHIFSVDDIKPSIEGMEYNGQRIDMFEAFAYDEGDNDETYEDEDGNVYFKHPYFFAKLKPLGFNLFDHAIEQQPMVISFTKGDCGACNFEIAVDEDTQKNTVQVDANGDLIYVDGRVLCGAEGSGQGEVQPQDIQQDTTNRSVWIALRKEEDTYGILMPKAPTKDEQGKEIGGHRPKGEKNADGTLNENPDTFVILGSNLPYEYIEYAEKKLEAEIIKYLKENNDEKFTFSINFSRIYFAENEGVLENLSENSKITIWYNGHDYDLYVTSFSYTMSEGDALPEIRVELDDTLKVSQNALQNAISEVKSQLGKAINSIDVVGASTPYFIRKDTDDEARGRINFTKGIKFGEGGKVEVLDNNSAKLTIEYLEVTKKASFTSLEIQEKTHVGGQILVTPAAINCGEVEEFDDFYRCYFQTKGADGDEIFNQFAAGDQAVCQTYNAWGSKYYWRLVTGIGEDYIDLSKTECDEDSGIPSAGDKIIQLGNQIDPSRQNAIVIAAYGDGSPYIIQYKGIDSFELSKDKMITKLASDENIFTGKVHMELGSDGFENLGGSLNIGKQNMLRNSGFTGDYLSEPLADQRVLDAADDLFSAPFDHWTKGENVTRVELPDDSMSGYGIQFPMEAEESLAQEMYYPVLNGEGYVLTFKAKGTSLTYSVGGVTKEVALTEEWAKYTEKIVATETSKEFVISALGATICEIQLERGTIATAWGNSPWDNSSDRAYIQSIAYLAESMTKDAMVEGSTDVLGGLILTNHIKVGNYVDGEMKKETAGMNGTYNQDSDVAFWAGGNFNQAIETVMQYADNPKLQPTEEQLASMAKFVVTHGGKAILNDIILRGIIYANDGEFKGKINIDAPNVDGRVQIDDSGLAYFGKHNDEEYMRVALGGTCQGASLATYAPNAHTTFCTNATMLAIGDEDTDAIHAKGNVWLYDGVVYVDKLSFLAPLSGDHGKIEGTVDFEGDVAFNGKVKGLQETIVISDSNMHMIDSKNGASVLVNMTSGTAKIALGSTNDGNEVIIESKGASIRLSASKSIYDHYNQAYLSSSINNRGIIRLKYYESAGEWTMTWIAKY
jgi:hypothetical protein